MYIVLFQVEWESSNGQFIALGNKMYQAYCKDKDEYKRSTKGVPHTNKFSMSTFKSVLLDETITRQTVKINSLRLNQNKEMTRTTMTKTSLSDIFLKLQVQPDRISCTPLTKNEKVL